jgi:hypothetical protein
MHFDINKLTRPLILLFAVSLSLIYFSFFLPFLSQNISFDENGFVYDGWNILKGQVPYKDFFNNKNIILMFMNFLGIAIFGFDHLLYRLFPFVLLYLSLVLFFVSLLKQKINAFLAFILAFSVIRVLSNFKYHDSINDAETYGIIFALFGFSILFWKNNEEQKKITLRGVVAGIFFACSILSKEPMIFPLIAIYILHVMQLRRTKSKLLSTASISIGGIAVAGIVVAYFIAHHALADYIYMYKWDIEYSKHYAKDMGWFTASSFSESFSNHTLHWKEFQHNDFIAFFAPFFLCSILNIKNSKGVLLLILSTALGIYAVSLGNCYIYHYYLMAIIAFLVPAVYCAKALTSKKKLLTGMKWLMCIVLLCMVCSDLSKHRNYFAWKVALPTVVPSGEMANFINKNSNTNDYIFILDSIPLDYILYNRLSSLRYDIIYDEHIRYYPGKTDAEKFDNLRKEMTAKMPKIILLKQSATHRQQRHLNELLYPFIVKHNYKKVGDFIYVL